MDAVSRTTLRTLVAQPEQACLSLFMALQGPGQGHQQNPVRFKQLLDEAEQHLERLDLLPREADAILDPIRQTVADQQLWERARSVAILSGLTIFRTFLLPYRTADQVLVGKRFYIRPLLQAIAESAPFYVLALSKESVRLLRAAPESVTQVEMPGVPTSLAEALQYDEFEKQHQLHPGIGTRGSMGERKAIFHGQGDHGDVEKEEIRRYFQQVDHGVHALLCNAQAPLVLAGVGYLLPIYRSVNTYPHLVEGVIQGNPDDWSAAELRDRALQVVRPIFMHAQQNAIERYHELAATGKTSSYVRKLVVGAAGGKVDTLLLVEGHHVWGTFDMATMTITEHREAQPGDEDLLNTAAVETLRHDGAVYEVAPQEIPGAIDGGAIFRY